MDISAADALRLLLFHIRGVDDMMKGVSFQDFTTIYPIEYAAERAFQIIARTIGDIPAELLGRHPGIHWQELQAYGQMIDARNPKVDSAFRWMLATKEIPALEASVAAMLARHMEFRNLVRGQAAVTA